jgi:hypothetical protein
VTVPAALEVNGNLTITGGTLDVKTGENNAINVAERRAGQPGRV